jgi:hypothetical protein
MQTAPLPAAELEKIAQRQCREDLPHRGGLTCSPAKRGRRRVSVHLFTHNQN